ncbi:MAG: hypothetical protein ABI237_18485 [Ginsengibacter sp.]
MVKKDCGKIVHSVVYLPSRKSKGFYASDGKLANNQEADHVLFNQGKEVIGKDTDGRRTVPFLFK